MDKLLDGQELIVRHTNPLNKELPSKGLKEYCPNNSWLETKQIENLLNERFNFINGERIAKSCSISQAQWIPKVNKAKVTKKIGKIWEILGHHQDNEDWLLPEEALFLAEICELQLFCGSVSISIEDCYKLVFSGGGCTLDEYRVYSYLSRSGLRVIRHSSAVAVTRYEKQIGLDSIVQTQKRPPPQQSDNEITIVDDDVCIIKEATLKSGSSGETSSQKETTTRDSDAIVIESDDEVKEIELSDSGDSDVVCISSPTYVPDKNLREWYPYIRKSLRPTMEKFIDLCDDNDIPDDKLNVRNRMDLIRPSKADILSYIPSVESGGNRLSVPDRRLLPPNVVPKYSEYMLKLSVKPIAETPYNKYGERQIVPFHASSRIPSQDSEFSGAAPFRNDDMNNVAQHPLVIQAQEMQAMATNMMQTAATIMTAMSNATQNPNELWELFGINRPLFPPGRNMPTLPPGNIRPTLPPVNNQFMPANNTRHFSHPRRSRPFNPRFQRRRPYYRRPWSGRRYNNSHPNVGNFKSASNSASPGVPGSSGDVVILSDDDDQGLDVSRQKRKPIDNTDVSKRLKVEHSSDDECRTLSDTSSCILESVSENIKKEPTAVIKQEENVPIKSEFDARVKSDPDEIRNDVFRESNETYIAHQPIKIEVKSEHDQINLSSESSNQSVGESHQVTSKKSQNSSLVIKSEPNPDSIARTDSVQGTNMIVSEPVNPTSFVNNTMSGSTDGNDSAQRTNMNVSEPPNPTSIVNNTVSGSTDGTDSAQRTNTNVTEPPNQTSTVNDTVSGSTDGTDSAQRTNTNVSEPPNPTSIVNNTVSGSTDGTDSAQRTNTNVSEPPNPTSIVNNTVSGSTDGTDSAQRTNTNVTEPPNPKSSVSSVVSTGTVIGERKEDLTTSQRPSDSSVKQPMPTATEGPTIEPPNNWEQFKDTFDDIEENDDSLTKFDECATYGNVLSSLMIFKQIEADRTCRKYKISYDVYLPDSNFKKSLKVLPNYRVIVLKSMEELPTSLDIEGLKAEYQDCIPFLFSIVFNETVAFYLYDSISLNVLID